MDKLSERIKGLPVAIEMTKSQRRHVHCLANEVAQLEAKNEEPRKASKKDTDAE